jgi:hypothetical protein
MPDSSNCSYLKGSTMKLLLLVLCSVAAVAQTAPQKVSIPFNAGGAWLKGEIALDSTLRLDIAPDGRAVLRAVVPPPPAAVARRYGVKLAYDATAKGWPLPPGAFHVEVQVNGLTNYDGEDYMIDRGVVIPLHPELWPPTHAVRVNHDVQQ